MIRSFTAIILLFAGIFFSHSAMALFEARVSYGLMTTNTDLDKACAGCTASAPSQAPTYGLGADALFDLPWNWVPRLGIRYENMGATSSGNGIDINGEFSRVALLLNWRWTHSMFYFGPTFSYGLSHSTAFKITQGLQTQGDFSPESTSSFSYAIEAGLKLIGFNVGAELGYLDMTWSNAKDSTGNAPTQDLQMSGPYGKFVLGFSI